MGREEERQNQVRELRRVASNLSQSDPEKLIRPELGTEWDLREARRPLVEIVEILKQFVASDFDHLPPQSVGGFMGMLNRISELFESINGFTSGQGPSQRLRLIDNAHGLWTQCSDVFGPFLVREALRTAGPILGAQKAEAEQALSRVREIVSAVERESTDLALSKEAQHFREEANRHRTGGFVWLTIAVLLAAATGFYAAWVLHRVLPDLPADLPIRRLVSLAVPRALILSVLWYGLVLATRNYTACRHNVVVNRHRQNALSTFRTFAAASDDPTTKNAILLQATQCIFAPQTTGYLKGESEPQQSNQILEIVRSLPLKPALPER